jgi:hypothetical protein
MASPSYGSTYAADRTQDGASHGDGLALELVAAIASMAQEQAACLAESGSPGPDAKNPGSRDAV